MAIPRVSVSGVLSADTAIKATPGALYWLTVSDTAALAIELNNHATGGGTDLWAINLPANGYLHAVFNPPLPFDVGIYLDVSTTTCKVTVGYV